jgi:hypothetical protein
MASRPVVTLKEKGEKRLQAILKYTIPQTSKVAVIDMLLEREYRRLIEAGIIPAAPEGEQS